MEGKTNRSDKDDEKRLSDIKKNIENSHKYFRENANRFNKMRRFIFFSTLSDDDKIKLMSLGKPVLTANVLEAYLSRMRGNFLNNEPSISVKNKEYSPTSLIQEQQIEFLDGYIRCILTNPEDNSFQYGVYTDTMSGGYSYAEVYTKYLSDKSWEQEIVIEKDIDPTMCGCDPTARESHKGDGEYIFRIVPLTYNKFKQKYGEEEAKNIKFDSNVSATGDFQWSYKNTDVDIVMVVEYYWKKYEEKTLYQLSDGKSVTKEEYKKILLEHEISKALYVAPSIVQERKQTFTTIMRDEICDNKILKSEETIYSKFPLVFADGNSQFLKDLNSIGITQVTRPWLYHAEGAQRLKDYCMQTSGAEIENMMMSKLMAPVEGLPQDKSLLNAYTNYQQASVITYNAYDLDDPTKQLPPPREIQRTPTPSIVMESFMACDRLIQQVTGDYDINPSIDSEISGESIKQGAVQTSEAAKPYQKSFNMFLQRIGEIIIDIIPKIYTTPRTVPILGLDGKNAYQVINDPNDPNSVSTEYDSSALKLTVEAGQSVAAQQQISLEQITKLAQTLPSFAQFLDQEGGADLIEATEIKSKEKLKIKYSQWMEQNKQTQAQQSQIAQQSQQAMQQALIQKEVAAAMKSFAEAKATTKKADDMEAQFVAKMILEEQTQREKSAIEAARVAIDQERAIAEAARVQIEAKQAQVESILRSQEIDAENARTAIESAIAVDKHYHDKSLDMANLKDI